MIYLDHAATTPITREALDAQTACARELTGNPSSVHAAGRAAKAALDQARDRVAASLEAAFDEVYFTSGGTESANLAVLGAADGAPPGRDHIVVSAVEHPAVLGAARALGARGWSVSYLGVDSRCLTDPDELAALITDRTALVSVMHANNETGSVQDIARCARVAHRRGALFHTDAVQSYALLELNVAGAECDLLSLSGHKIGGPTGVGALYVRRGVRVRPLLIGGAQERSLRPGTENVAASVGLAAASELAASRRTNERTRLRALRHYMLAAIERDIPGARLNGEQDGRLPSILNVAFPGADAAALVVVLDRAGVAASAGAACSAGAPQRSHVLAAMGLPDPVARSGIRFSFGSDTTRADIDAAVPLIAEAVTQVRGLAR